jgi:hypothetical protein
MGVFLQSKIVAGANVQHFLRQLSARGKMKAAGELAPGDLEGYEYTNTQLGTL